MSNFQVATDQVHTVLKYFLKVLKKRAVGDSDYTASVQFSDLTKKNVHKLLHLFMTK
jgi:hypothetical protein